MNFRIDAGGRFISTCGVFHWDDTARTCELGIREREFWGRGYGREAFGLPFDYAFRLDKARCVWLTTSSDNPRTQRAYAPCGFVEAGLLRDEWLVDDGR